MRRPGLVMALGSLAGLAGGLTPPTDCAPAYAEEAQAPALRVLTLADVERSAASQQPQMLVARAATRVAEAQTEETRAPLLPQLTGTASYTLETGNYAPRPGVVGPAPGGNFFSKAYSVWNFGLTGTQLVYDFGQTYERYDAAKQTVDAQKFAEQTTRYTIVANVRRAYFNARAFKALVGVARESLDDQDRHLTQVQGFVQVGTQPPIALAQQKAAVANARVQLITAQNNYETAKAQLNQAAGMVGGTEYDVSDEELPPVDGEDQPLSALVARAMATRPELATLQKERDAQDSTVRAVKGGYGPTLSAVAGATYGGEQLDQLVPNWSVEGLLSWPIYQGGLTRGQVHQAEATLDSIDAQRSLEALQVQLDVDSARLAVSAAKATIGASDDALTNAREQLRLAEQRYATGVGSIIELNDAQVAYTTAAAQVVQARYGLASPRAQLLAALGRT